jgi:F-type H+-transporting ATPase subunit a
MLRIKSLIIFFLALSLSLGAQYDQNDHSNEDSHSNEQSHGSEEEHHYGPGECMPVNAHHKFDVGETAMHHISDANVYSIGPWQIPLPVILYSPEQGWDLFMSSKFKPGWTGHGNGKIGYNNYVLHGGTVKRVHEGNLGSGEIEIEGFGYNLVEKDGKEKRVDYVCANGKQYNIDYKSTADGGIFGGGITSFYDFSITKNVVTMLLVFLILGWIFFNVAKAYKKRDGKAPTGMQNFFEPLITFIRDEVAKPFLGHKWERYFPFLLSIFFFILGLNLIGQIPFLGNANVTGNLAVTAVLAIITFIVTNVSGNAHYWKHLLIAPGVPAFVKPILIPVEILGLFIKPLTLMLRLFANITAGHLVIVVFVGLIFMFGKSGESLPGTFGAAIGSTLLTLFMMSIELIVAFVQAFVFTILTASYIGAATEEEHH